MTDHIAISKGRRGRGPRSRKAKASKRKASIDANNARAGRLYVPKAARLTTETTP